MHRSRQPDTAEARARAQGTTDPEVLHKVKVTAGLGGRIWWESESKPNDSVYVHTPAFDTRRYARTVASLPSCAFLDEDKDDQTIYADAMNYGATVLVTHARATIIDELLERHFIAAGAAAPPVTVRSLWNETVAIAESENRDIDDVGLEAVLCAVVPERWDRAAATAMEVHNAATGFVRALRSELKKPRNVDPDHEKLASVLTRMLTTTRLERFVTRCESAHARLPATARASEERYRQATA